MSTTAVLSESTETVADLLARLGGLCPERVRMSPMPGTATEEDLIALLESPRKRLCELVDGVLVEKVMGLRESWLAMRLGYFLQLLLQQNPLGFITAPDGPLRLFSGRVRMPDVAFIDWHRLPSQKIPTEPIPALVPDLAAEILSDSNTPGEMTRKREDYFQAGVRLVWEIDPAKRTVQVFTGLNISVELNDGDTLDGGDVLPGFRLAVTELFGEKD